MIYSTIIYSAVSFSSFCKKSLLERLSCYFLRYPRVYTFAPHSNINLTNRDGNGVHPKNNKVRNAFKLQLLFYILHSICVPSSAFSTLCVHRVHILFKINLNFELGNIYFILKVAVIYRFYVLSSGELLDYFPYFILLVTILKYPKRVSLLYRGLRFCVGIAKAKKHNFLIF